MPFIEVMPIVDPRMRGLCRKEYPNHKKGCPNWNKKAGCPPGIPLINEVIDLTKPVYAIYNVFDLAGHINKMKLAHPQWTWRQLVNCLYWQPKARKRLKYQINVALHNIVTNNYDPRLMLIGNPEAHGVNLTETMKNAGIELEWPPKTKTYQIVLAGSRIEPLMAQRVMI